MYPSDPRSTIRSPWRAWPSAKVCGTGAAAGLAAGLLFFYFVTLPGLAARDQAASDLALQLAENRKSVAFVAQYDTPDYKAHVAEVDREYERTIAQIPTEAERDHVLDDIGKLVNSAKGTVSAAKFGDPKSLQPGRPGLDSVAEVPVHLEVQASFANIKSILAAFASDRRLISIGDFSLAAREDQSTGGSTLVGSFELTTYFKTFPPDPAQPDPAAPPGGTP